MNIYEKLKEIKEHFANLSIQEYESNLIESGIETVQTSSLSDMTMISEEELNSLYVYIKDRRKVQTTNYNFYESDEGCVA